MPKMWIKKTVEKEWAQKNYSITFFMHCIAGLMPIHWLKNHKSGRKNWTQKISTEMPRKWVNRRCEQEQKKIAHKWTHTHSISEMELESQRTYRRKKITRMHVIIQPAFSFWLQRACCFYLYSILAPCSLVLSLSLHFSTSSAHTLRHSVQFNLSIFICNS